MNDNETGGTALADAPADQADAQHDETKTAAVSLEIPIRMLHVIRVAAKENGRYAIDGVYIETRDEEGLISAAATDGRRLVVAEWNRGLFDDEAHILLPGMIARNVIRLATRARTRDDEPMAAIKQKGENCTLTVFTTAGDVEFHWTAMELGFPPYLDIIPDFSDSTGVARIAIKPELFYGALKALQQIVGDEMPVKFYLPNTPDRAIGLESQKGDVIKALAIIMPVKLEEWTEAAAKASGPAAPAEPAAPEAWRSVALADLKDADDKPLTPSILKALSENSPSITTIGDVADWTAGKSKAHGGENRLTDIDNIGPAAAEKIDAICFKYHMDHPQTSAAAPEPAAAPAAPLVWDLGKTDGEIFAANTAGIGIKDGDDELLAEFVIALDEEAGQFDISGTDADLMPENAERLHPTVDAAKAWCDARNADLVAAKSTPTGTDPQAAPADNPTADATTTPASESATSPAESDAGFDDDAIASTESVVAIAKTLVISIGQRAGGRWASCHYAAVGKHDISTKMDGHYASRAEAITAAADAVHGWIKAGQAEEKFASKHAGKVKEIVGALDDIDKSIAPSPGSAEAENRQAVGASA